MPVMRKEAGKERRTCGTIPGLFESVCIRATRLARACLHHERLRYFLATEERACRGRRFVVFVASAMCRQRWCFPDWMQIG